MPPTQPVNQNFQQIAVLQAIADALKAQANPTTLQNVGYQSSGVDSTPAKLKIQTGWGYIQGNNTTVNTKTVTFPTAFSGPPIIIINPMGLKPGVPTSPGDNPSNIFGGMVQAISATSNQFVATYFQSSALSNTLWVLFSYIAIGT